MLMLAVLLAATRSTRTFPGHGRTRRSRSSKCRLSKPKYLPVHISEESLLQNPNTSIYKTYPVYHPDREPAGYMEWLKNQEPEIAFDPARLTTQGRLDQGRRACLQRACVVRTRVLRGLGRRDRTFYERTGMPVAKDGTIPFARWVVRKKGQLELGSMGCNTCHTRVMKDGKVVPGAQGNNPGDRQGASMLRRAAAAGASDKVVAQVRGFARQFEVPGLTDDPNRLAQGMSLDQLIAAGTRSRRV